MVILPGDPRVSEIDVGEIVMLGIPRTHGEGVAVGLGVGTGVAVGLGVGTGVGTGVAVGLGVGTGVAVGLGVGTGVGAGVGTGVAVGLGVGTGVVAGVGTGVGTGVAVGAGVGTGVGTGVGAGPPTAAITALAASTIPAPQPTEQPAGPNGWAVERRMETGSAASVGLLMMNNRSSTYCGMPTPRTH